MSPQVFKQIINDKRNVHISKELSDVKSTTVGETAAKVKKLVVEAKVTQIKSVAKREISIEKFIK